MNPTRWYPSPRHYSTAFKSIRRNQCGVQTNLYSHATNPLWVRPHPNPHKKIHNCTNIVRNHKISFCQYPNQNHHGDANHGSKHQHPWKYFSTSSSSPSETGQNEGDKLIDVPSSDVDEKKTIHSKDHNNEIPQNLKHSEIQEGNETEETEKENEEDEDETTEMGHTAPISILKQQLRPCEVVAELNRHIVGQDDAKKAVAIAMRNRWRRKQLSSELQKEVTPRNVLMIGPTGCGKTEVARRMAALCDAPFIKVEATKFTEVGYHGRDVDQIIRDLIDIAINQVKKRKTEEMRGAAQLLAEDRILDLLAGPKSTGRESFRHMLRNGSLDDQEIEVDIPIVDKSGGGVGAGGVFTFGASDASGNNNPNIAALSDFLTRVSGSGSGRRGPPTERKKVPISEAREVIVEIELDRMLENVDIKKEAITATEESGIVFIDEIDKICSSRENSYKSADASAEGVQRDLLPIIEGTTISTKHGNVNTDYILFIGSGAFHSVKPSDMLPELQGRLPIRVELMGLTEDDLYRILTEPVANLLRQQIELIATEGVTLRFEDDAVREIARMAALLNKTVENIGARRLHTVIERIMEQISFNAADLEPGSVQVVDKKLVQDRLSDVLVSSDLSRYIL